MKDEKSTVRIEEAIKFANESGKTITKRELAAICWPEGNYKAQEINMRSLVNGKRKRIEPQLLCVIARETGVTVDYLVYNTDNPTNIIE